ncbi:MAG: PPOX class F420-dependent oxidoreductase [Solirubrobacterales bacterium]
MNRLVDLQYKALDRMRHRNAFEVARRPGIATDFDGFRGARQCLVVTFKRSGEPVPTPVNFGLASGRLYFRSEPRSAKVKRLRRDPHVRVCPCNLRGRPTGEVVEGTARVLSSEEAEQADAALAGNWTKTMLAMERGLDRLPIEIVYVEVEPSAPEPQEVKLR